MWNIHQHFYRVRGGGGEESAITKEKKPQTLFSSKSMYFALILLGI